MDNIYIIAPVILAVVCFGVVVYFIWKVKKDDRVNESIKCIQEDLCNWLKRYHNECFHFGMIRLEETWEIGKIDERCDSIDSWMVEAKGEEVDSISHVWNEIHNKRVERLKKHFANRNNASAEQGLMRLHDIDSKVRGALLQIKNMC